MQTANKSLNSNQQSLAQNYRLILPRTPLQQLQSTPFIVTPLGTEKKGCDYKKSHML
jgi:hypothetical protein